jgi:hypothetical protein
MRRVGVIIKDEEDGHLIQCGYEAESEGFDSDSIVFKKQEVELRISGKDFTNMLLIFQGKKPIIEEKNNDV